MNYSSIGPQREGDPHTGEMIIGGLTSVGVIAVFLYLNAKYRDLIAETEAKNPPPAAVAPVPHLLQRDFQPIPDEVLRRMREKEEMADE